MKAKSVFKKFFFLYSLGANLKTKIGLIGQGILLPILFHLPVVKVGKWVIHDRYQWLSNRKAKLFSLIQNEQVVEVKLRTQDFSILYEVFMDHAYPLDRTLPKDISIVDLGAHIGLFGVYVKSKLPLISYVGLEPEKENYSLLLYNTQSFSNFTCINKAIWRDNLGVGLMDNPIRYNIETSNDYPINVKSTTIETLLAEINNGPIGIKIDIEGAESVLFEGSVKWLDNVVVLWIEWHEGVDRNFCEGLLLNSGLTLLDQSYGSISVWVR